MPASPDAPAAAGFTLDDATHTIRFERELASSPDRAFDAWTKPEEIGLWWDPTGEPLATCDIDLRVGGAFTFINRAHPDRPFTGVYRELERPRRIVFDALGSIGRVLLEPRAAGTRMTVEIACQTAEQLQGFVAMGVAVGTAQTLDNLVARLGEAVAVG